MNKNTNILVAAVVVLVGVAGLVVIYDGNKQNQAKEAVKAEVEQAALTQPVEPKVAAAETQAQNTDENNQDQTVEGTLTYTISNGTVSYTAQKRFLQKEDAVVVGTTPEVTGNGSFDVATGAVKLAAALDFKTIKSDSAKRDSDILPIFKDTKVSINVDAPISGVKVGEAFTAKVPVMLTINGVTKEVVFTVSGKLTESSLQAKGEANIKMSDFGVKAPSAAGIFTVDDEIMISFNITADKQ